jgi:acetyl esterase/lipase
MPLPSFVFCVLPEKKKLRILVTLALYCLTVARFPHEQALAQGQTTAKRTTSHSFPLTKFYDTPDPLPRGEPGELIRSMEFDAYDLPLRVSAVRIVYHSRSANGDDVASSGVVLFPDKEAPPGGWPVIAWAHDWTGVARECAPSLSRSLQHGSLLSMYVNEGYAVVASDYTGLGTSFRHTFADAPSSAWDAIYAIPAARRAAPQLGSRWIAMGTGEGAINALSVAELEHDIRNPNYLGSIALSPLKDLQEAFEPSASFSANLALFLAYGVKTIYPKFEPGDILTDRGIQMYRSIGQACGESSTEPGLSASAILKPGWETSPFVQKYFQRNRLGLRSAEAPLLVVVSQDDPSIKTTASIVERLCRQGDRIQLEKYPEGDPGRVIGDSVRDQIAWIQARFANRSAPSNCPAQH